MHALPEGLTSFYVGDPPPSCDEWRKHMPGHRDRDAFELYDRARRLWRSKIEWQLTKDETEQILRDVRSAAAKGDWGAKALLATFYREGLGPLDSNHVLDPDPERSVALVRQAVNAGQPWAYYDLGVAYEHGYGGVPYDKDIAWAYYLKAAELGSPDAQMALASAYNSRQRWDDEKAMLTCAYKQGHGHAAYMLAVYAKLDKKYDDALKFYQQGTKFGSQRCAASLYLLFDPKLWNQEEKADREALMDAKAYPDGERRKRYRQISAALEINPDLRFGRLDQVLPLPPAELPAWTGIEDAMDPETEGPPAY